MHGNGWASAARHPALLGIDLAGHAVTSVVTDLAGRVLARAGARVALSRPRPGWVEVDPLDWLAATIVTIRRAVHEAGVRPQAIGLAGQPHGLVLVDTTGRPVRPAVLWPDTRAMLWSTAYEDLPGRIRRRLVNPLDPASVGPMLCWIAGREPDSWARARWALQPKDWLRAQLTGEYLTEPSDASATLIYDFVAGDWSGEAVQRLGLDRGRLPVILPGAGHQAGLVTRRGAELIGLRPGTPVAAGAARTAAAALGTGLADGNTAQVVLGPRARVVASIRSLPTALPVADRMHIHRAATDHGWCITASVAAVGEHLAAAVRSVAALTPLSRLVVRGSDEADPALLATLADLVDQPLHAADPPDPAARAAALLGARAAGLLNEESLRAQFPLLAPPTVEPKEVHS